MPKTAARPDPFAAWMKAMPMAGRFPAAPVMAPAMAPALRRLFETQDRILGEVEAFSRHWFERRHEAARSAVEAAGRIAENGSDDPAEAQRLVGEWCSHSAERLSQDAQEGLNLIVTCTSHMVQGGTAAVEAQGAAAAEVGERAAQAGTRAAKADAG